jgi:hypothetical protein
MADLILERLREVKAPAPVRGTELRPATVTVALDHPLYHLFLSFLSFGAVVIYILTYTCIYIYVYVPLQPHVLVSPAAASLGTRTQVRCVEPPLWWRSPHTAMTTASMGKGIMSPPSWTSSSSMSRVRDSEIMKFFITQ